MYQNLFNEMKDKFQPLYNIADIQSKITQNLICQHLDLLGDYLDIGVRQIEKLRKSEEFSAMARVPLETSRALSEKWVDAVGHQWWTLMEARDAMNGIVESAVQKESALTV